MSCPLNRSVHVASDNLLFHMHAVSDTYVNFWHQDRNQSDSVVMFIGWTAWILVDVNPKIPTKLSVT